MGIEQSKNRNYAYDLAKKVLTKGEVLNTEAINVSLENILSTSFGERIFLLEFGSPLFSSMFENLNENTGDALLDKIIQCIEKWEDRIFIHKTLCKLQIIVDQNTLVLSIPYSIIQNNLTGTFKKRIVFG